MDKFIETMRSYIDYSKAKPEMNSYENGLVIFLTRAEAEAVLDRLWDDVEIFGRTSLDRYYMYCDCALLHANEDYKSVGWHKDEIQNIKRIVMCMDGYYIPLPPTHEIEKLD